MPKKIAPAEESIAYRLAAIAVTGFALGVRVREVQISRRSSAKLPPLVELCDPADPTHGPLVEAYVTTLVAGNVGVKICVEDRYGITDPNHPWVRHDVVCGCLPDYRELDEALLLALAWLQAVDNGDTERTIERLYRRASILLREPPHRQRLPPLVAELLLKKKLSPAELRKIEDAWT